MFGLRHGFEQGGRFVEGWGRGRAGCAFLGLVVQVVVELGIFVRMGRDGHGTILRATGRLMTRSLGSGNYVTCSVFRDTAQGSILVVYRA